MKSLRIRLLLLKKKTHTTSCQSLKSSKIERISVSQPVNPKFLRHRMQPYLALRMLHLSKC